jgi:hypothetical protein
MIVKFTVVVHWIHSLSDELFPPNAFGTREAIHAALLPLLSDCTRWGLALFAWKCHSGLTSASFYEPVESNDQTANKPIGKVL